MGTSPSFAGFDIKQTPTAQPTTKFMQLQRRSVKKATTTIATILQTTFTLTHACNHIDTRTDRHTLIHRTSLSDHVGSEDVRFKNCNNNSKCRHNNNNNNNNGCKSREEEEQQQEQQQKPRRQREKPEKRHSFFCFCLKRTSAAAQWRIVIE